MTQRTGTFSTFKSVLPNGMFCTETPTFIRATPQDNRTNPQAKQTTSQGNQDSPKDSQANPKCNRAITTVNRAIAQSRPSGILFAQANGKLCFEYLKTFSVPENHLLLQRVKTPPKSAFLSIIQLLNYSVIFKLW